LLELIPTAELMTCTNLTQKENNGTKFSKLLVTVT
jgi:hypothetical protein